MGLFPGSGWDVVQVMGRVECGPSDSSYSWTHTQGKTLWRRSLLGNVPSRNLRLYWNSGCIRPRRCHRCSGISVRSLQGLELGLELELGLGLGLAGDWGHGLRGGWLGGVVPAHPAPPSLQAPSARENLLPSSTSVRKKGMSPAQYVVNPCPQNGSTPTWMSVWARPEGTRMARPECPRVCA